MLPKVQQAIFCIHICFSVLCHRVTFLKIWKAIIRDPCFTFNLKFSNIWSYKLFLKIICQGNLIWVVKWSKWRGKKKHLKFKKIQYLESSFHRWIRCKESERRGKQKPLGVLKLYPINMGLASDLPSSV